jgi:hypothetical protein
MKGRNLRPSECNTILFRSAKQVYVSVQSHHACTAFSRSAHFYVLYLLTYFLFFSFFSFHTLAPCFLLSGITLPALLTLLLEV